MQREATAMTVRQNLGELLNEVQYRRDSIVVTNTVNLPAEKRLEKLTVLNVAPLFAAAIERIHSGQSVGALFE